MSLNNITGNKYGLIIPKQKTAKESVKITPEQSAFGDDSEEEEDAKFKQSTFDSKMETLKAGLRKTTKVNIEKALEEDASVFQYDEIYDNIIREKDQKLLEKNMQYARKPKYVQRLLEVSAVRKLEKELLNERKAQRELEAEKEKYAGKESFVTGAFKAKMTELRKLVDRRREEEAREETMDITKQDGLGGFYRFMFQQKTGCQPTKQHESTTEKDIGAKRRSPSSSRSHSPPPQRRDREVNKSDRPLSTKSSSPSLPRVKHRCEDCRRDRLTSSSRTRSPSSPPRHGNSRIESNRRSKQPRHRPDGKHISSSSSRHRYQGSPQGSNKKHRSCRRHSSSASRGATNSRSSCHHVDDRKIRDDKKDHNERRSLKGDTKEEKRVEQSPPPPGFIRAKPRQITDEEVQKARERYLARKSAGLNRAAVVHSDDEC